ncbi:MAG: 2'-5' RNA ligase family protein [Pseudonocardiaceae bacterium]
MASTPCPGNAEEPVHALVAFLDDSADREVRALWQVLHDGGIPPVGRRFPPHVTFGAGASIPARARTAVRDELALLTLPGVWLSTLATFPNANNVLMLAAVVDTELLAVHSAVHDALAGKVRQPSVLHLPGSWVPHCTLAERITPAQLSTGFARLHPVAPVRATLGPIAVLDTAVWSVEPLWPQ